MTLRTLTETLDNLYTTTWQNMKDTVKDQIFDATPFWFWLRDKGHLTTQEGGRFITEPLVYAKNDSVKWIGKGGTVSLNDKEILTVAKYDWRYLVGNVVRFGVDDQQNRGKHQIINFMNAKMDNLKMALVDELETRLFAGSDAVTVSTTTEDAPAFDGLQRLVADDPTAAVSVGDIPQNTYTWWRNKIKDMTGISFATSGVKEMRTLLHNTGQNQSQDTPDIIVSGQTPYEFYEEEARADHLRLTNTKLAEMGFDHQTFKGLPMIWSPACSNQRMYFLNTRFIKFVYDPMMLFEPTEWKPIPEQPNDRAMQVMSACSLTISRRRTCGVMFDIDTA